jgi:hypothetical protein
MKALGILFSALALLGMAGALGAATMEMANLAPADAKAIVETVNAAELRQTLLESKFWAALQKTEGSIEWRASDRYAQMQQRLDQFLDNLKMRKEEALTMYLSGRTGVILLESGEKKPWGVIVTECKAENAKRLIDASGGVEEATKRGDVTIYEVQKENRVDRLAAAGGVFLATSATGDALERVLDVIAGSAPRLAADEGYKEAVRNLPEGWRIRAYAAKTPPHKNPGAVAMYVEGPSRLHFEWRIVGDQADLAAINTPVLLTAPSVLPAKAVAAVASSFHPAAIWEFVKTKVAEQGDAAVEKLRRAEMFIRGWFPGQTMEQITAGFGPEGALALLEGDGDAAPSILGMARLADKDGTAAKSFRNGLAAKAMLLAALGDQNPNTPKLNVREEVYGNAQLLIIEAPGALEKIAGDWAKDIALTVAVTDEWLIVGTAPAGVKAAIDTAAGNAPSLADDQADVLPKGKATRWGVVQPARGADIVLSLVEKLAGKATVDQARKATNLAEVMKLVKRFVWTRVDEPNVIRGEADIQATD